MKTSILLLTISLSIFFASCKKAPLDPKLPPPPPSPIIVIPKDSVAYKLDGLQYNFISYLSFSRSNGGANFDTTKDTWDVDTMQYRTSITLGKLSPGNSSDGDGTFEISFIKKYLRSSLVQSPLGIKLPATEKTDLYAIGEYKYAFDVGRYNHQNGIALLLTGKTTTGDGFFATYSDAPIHSPSSIGSDSHKDSKFEITKSQILTDGSLLVEAVFTANVFDRNEQMKKLDNGFMRLRIL